jgi:hypothetical protein
MNSRHSPQALFVLRYYFNRSCFEKKRSKDNEHKNQP